MLNERKAKGSSCWGGQIRKSFAPEGPVEIIFLLLLLGDTTGGMQRYLEAPSPEPKDRDLSLLQSSKAIRPWLLLPKEQDR